MLSRFTQFLFNFYIYIYIVITKLYESLSTYAASTTIVPAANRPLSFYFKFFFLPFYINENVIYFAVFQTNNVFFDFVLWITDAFYHDAIANEQYLARAIFCVLSRRDVASAGNDSFQTFVYITCMIWILILYVYTSIFVVGTSLSVCTRVVI